MCKSNIELLRHILDEIVFILENTKDKNSTLIKDDPLLSRAVVRSLEIIGEASRKLDATFIMRYHHIEWRKISDTRNRLIHNYMGVDYDIVWNIITDKLPTLQLELESIVQENT